MSARARKPKLLIVDDGDRYAELAHALLRDYDYATRCERPGPCWTCEVREGCVLTHAHDAAETDAALAKHPDVDVVLLDVAFDVPEDRLLPSRDPSADVERRRRYQGIDILAHLRRSRGNIPVVLMTSLEELAFEEAAEALAVDELATLAGSDAFDARALGLLVERVLARRREVPEGGGYAWGKSPPMQRLRRDAHTLARTSLPVLLLGETGTGKSALAERVIHPATGRKGPFVAVDLAAFPSTLVAAELFGTARGAFSGAVEREGRFEAANGGTLLLDEVGNLPLEVQKMLLLTLQDARITRLGESVPRPIDVKVIAATNADLAGAVRAGTFRADLYARLNPSARLVLPRLGERIADLRELAAAFVRKTFAAGADRALLASYLDAAGLDGPPHAELAIGTAPADGVRARGVTFVLSRAAVGDLEEHPWPGNVRELELLIHSAAVFALADALAAIQEGRPPPAGAARTIPLPNKLVRDLLAAAGGGRDPGAAVDAPGDASMRLRVGAAPTLNALARELERQVYQRLFDETGGDFEAMARRLLAGDATTNGRRVRLRFNQLGLRVRRKS